MSDLFCKDCKHSRDTGIGPYKLVCESPKNVVEHVAEEKYLVSGITQPVIQAMRGSNCAALRQRRTPEIEATVCGPTGKWFERKGS